MKKIIAIFFMVGVVFGAFHENQAIYLAKVRSAYSLEKNALVTLKGHLGNEEYGIGRYKFTDGENTIMLDIDYKLWFGSDIKSKDYIEITGEIIKEGRNGTLIKVKSMRKIRK